MCVAEDTGIGGPASEIFIDKIFYDKSTKLFPDIQNIMCKAMFYSGLSCVIETIYVAAACFFLAATAGGVIPCFHGDADDFIAFIIEHQGGNGTVNTAAHGHQNFSFFTHDFKKCKLQIY